MWRAFFHKDSIIKWMIQTHGPLRRRYLEIMLDPQYAHIRFIRLRTPSEARAFLDSI
jgi:hypothetical protein